MKPLLMWQSDYRAGGGSVAMYRLLCGLRRANVEARMLCEYKTTDSPYVDVLNGNRWLDDQVQRLTFRVGLNDVHRISSFAIPKHPTFRQADLLHIHGTHSGFLSYLALPRLARLRPTVFTMHDMWALTGHCGYSHDCERWRTGCGCCPYPEAYPPIRRDTSALEWRLKRWTYARMMMTVVAPSQWLASLARESILGRFPVLCIPNGVDTEAYQPLDRGHCRDWLGLPRDKRLILFAGMNLDDRRKGFDLLFQALEGLPGRLKAETALVAFGGRGEDVFGKLRLPLHNLGYLTTDPDKAMAYSAADMFVLPTRAENNPLVALESLACGTPVVSFRVGGVPEVVRHEQTGLLSEAEDAARLRENMLRLLEDGELRSRLGRQGRALIERGFTIEQHVARHIELYAELLQTGPHHNGPARGNRAT